LKKTIIDKEEAFLRAGNDWEMLSLMVGVYFDFSKKQLALLDDAIKSLNLVEINSISHTLRGSLGMLGSIEAYQSALELDEISKRGEADNVQTFYNNLCSDIQMFDEALKKFLHEKKL